MEVELRIGRDVGGANAIHVPATYSKVSRNHASIRWQDGMVTIEDNGSTNGTYVNGQRVSRANITENDTVWLGGNGADNHCYQLDLRRVFSLFPKERPTPYVNPAPYVRSVEDVESNTQRTDYSREFAQLKQAYIDYHKGMANLTKKANTSAQLPKVLLSTIPTLLGAVIWLVSKDMTMRTVGMPVGFVLSGLIVTLTMGRSSSKKEKMSEAILDLQLKYQKLYRCPKCGKEYNLDMHWKKLQADGKCPYGCGARFVN